MVAFASHSTWSPPHGFSFESRLGPFPRWPQASLQGIFTLRKNSQAGSRSPVTFHFRTAPSKEASFPKHIV